MRNANGFTLTELVVVVGLGAGICLAIANSLPNVQSFMLSSRLRQQANTEGRVTLDTVRHLLIIGIPGTRVIASSGSGPPQSDIQFNATDGMHYEIGCSMGTAFFTVTSSSGSVNTKTLATNVTVFSFIPDVTDPTAVGFRYESETSLDNSGKAERMYRIELPAEIRMEGS